MTKQLAITRTILALASFTLATLFGSAPFADTAAAGTFTVQATCGGSWTKVDGAPGRTTAYESCPRLIVRNVLGNFRSPLNSSAAWVFHAPPGTTLQGARFNGHVKGGPSWWAILEVSKGGWGMELTRCDFEHCFRPLRQAYDFPDATKIVARVRCAEGGNGCTNSGSSARAEIDISGASIIVNDPAPPTPAFVGGGTLNPAGWNGGVRTVHLSGRDNTGIKQFDALVDGDAKYGTDAPQPCDYTKGVPCSDQANTAVEVDLRGLPDGQHAISGRAIDAGDNAADTPAVLFNVDNTPPLAPTNPRVVGGGGFRSKNRFDVEWANQPQQFAPIAGANYAVCPQGQPFGSPQCVSGTRDGLNLTRIDDIAVPGPGAWKLRLWLYDAAGNATQVNGVTLGGLGLVAGPRAADESKRRNTKLTAGRRRGKNRRLASRPRVKLGERVKLRGRLTAGRGKKRRGVAGQELLVYRRVQIQGAAYKRVGKIRTGKRGRYRYRVGAGPSRRFQIVYPGGELQGDIAKVNVRVRAKLKMRTDRRTVRNGEAVALSGRLRGGKLPPNGALLELQVYTRGRWRPFATPRTDASGRYLYQYRFATVRGTASFRFRAVLRRQATYPFTGRSRPVRVRVLGL